MSNEIQVWLTHRWNEEIFSVLGTWNEDNTRFSWQEGTNTRTVGAEHVFQTAEAAIADAEARRVSAISTYRSNIADLEKLDFSTAIHSVPVWQTMARRAGWKPPSV